jgi:hypothetical protein
MERLLIAKRSLRQFESSLDPVHGQTNVQRDSGNAQAIFKGVNVSHPRPIVVRIDPPDMVSGDTLSVYTCYTILHGLHQSKPFPTILFPSEEDVRATVTSHVIIDLERLNIGRSSLTGTAVNVWKGVDYHFFDEGQDQRRFLSKDRSRRHGGSMKNGEGDETNENDNNELLKIDLSNLW